jgi:hypothetical protein
MLHPTGPNGMVQCQRHSFGTDSFGAVPRGCRSHVNFSLDILQKNAMLIHKPYTKINTQLLPRRQNGNVQVCFEPTMQSIHHIFLLPLLFMRALYSYITAAISHPPLANCQSKIINPQSLPPPECWHNRIH